MVSLITKTYAFFPTTVLAVKVPDHEALNKALLRKIEELRSGAIAGNWQSEDTLHAMREFEPLCGFIKKGAEEYFSFMEYDVHSFSITALWANVLERGEAHRPHIHPNNLVSGAYYVRSDAADASNEIHFSDPRQQSLMIQPKVRKRTTENAGAMSLPAAEGVLYIFPSWLQHYVKSNMSRRERVSVSFNVMAEGELGTHTGFSFAKWPEG